MSSMNILFICMGNICRSPTAHGVFRQYIEESGLSHQVTVDSAGTHAYHVGEAPDARSQTHALKRGYDLLLVMDWENYALTEQRCPPNKKHKIRRLTEFCKVNQASVVPDPYYKGSEGFEEVLDLVEDACDGLLDHVRQRLLR